MSRPVIQDILDAGRVRRFHTVPSQPHQTVAEHSWGVVMILTYIYPGATAATIRYAMVHDLGESATGDIPAHAKWRTPALVDILEKMETEELARLGLPDGSDLSHTDHAAVKAADLLDLLLFSRRFAADPDMIVICERVESYFHDHRLTLVDPFPRVKEFIRDRTTDRFQKPRPPSNSG